MHASPCLQIQSYACNSQWIVERGFKATPLGQNVTGNAFVLASVSCTVKTLIEESLHDTILKIQSAKDVIKDDYIKLHATALESSDKFFPSMKELSFGTLDFGWEKLSSMALLATPELETAFLMLNVEEPLGILLRMGFGKEEAPRFVNFLYNFN